MGKILVVLWVLAWPMLVFSQESAGDSSELALENFLDMKIVTATQTEQKAAEAPAIVAVLTAEQIRKLGVTTLYEALSYLPGIIVSESYFGYTTVTMRGILQTHYNNKVLLLINGHPMREVVNGSFHLEIIPIEAVARIEVIRGPGSALYGTNAFSGIINILTFRSQDAAVTKAEIGAGSFETFEASVSHGVTEDSKAFFVSASSRNDRGYPFNVEIDENGQSGTIDYENDISNFWLDLAVGPVDVSMAYFNQKKMKFGITPVLDYTGPNYFKGGFLDLRIDRPITDELSIHGNLRYDALKREFYFGHFPYDGFQGHENADSVMSSGGQLYGAELSLNYNPSTTLSLLAGAVLEDSTSKPYVFKFEDDQSLHPYSAYTTAKSSNETSLFFQGLYFITERSHVVLGGRYNTNSDSGSSLVPRAGLVVHLGGETYFKALFAEAYRSPDFFEKNVATYNVLYGSQDLKPEKVRSYDLAIDTRLYNSTSISLNLFALETNDLVTRVPTTHPDTTGPNASEYVNAGGEDIMGVETNVMSALGKKVTLVFDHSYMAGTSVETDDSLKFIPRNTANVYCDVKIMPAFSVIPQVQFIDRRGETESYTLVHLSMELKLNNSITFSLSGRNLLDADYSYPEYVRNKIDEIPGGAGRSFFVRAYWRF
jgi:outer membrane receptor for ferrienterochelin and colicins